MKGFILKDLLLTLIIILILFPVIVYFTKIVSGFEIYDKRIQDEISLLNLSKRLIIIDDIELSNSALSYRDDDQLMTLKFDGERVYLSPGYQLILDDVSEVQFYEDSGVIYISYIKEDRYYERALTIA